MKKRQKLLRACYQVLYPLLWLGVIVTRRSLKAVRVVVIRDEQILLVRHTYGNRKQWLLPGGSVKRKEDLVIAAAREVREEVGLTIEPRPLDAISFRHLGTDITNYGFWAEVPAVAEVKRDPVELAETEWFNLNDLPELALGMSEIIDMAHACISAETEL